MITNRIVAGRGRLRVMQVALSLTPGGTERLVVEIAKRLVPDFDSMVCCLDEPGEWAAELTTVGVEVVALGRRPGFRPSVARAIGRIAAERRVDVAHCHHYSPYVYGRLGTLMNRSVRVIYTEHGRLSDRPESLKRRTVNPLLGRLPSTICAVSQDLRRHMIASGFPASRVGVVYNGIEPLEGPSAHSRALARERLALDPNAYVIGTVARLDPVKDLGTLIAAFHTIATSRRDAHLVVVGDGPDRAALDAQVQARQLCGRVHMIGYHAEPRAVMAGFDVYVNSSTTEGVSLTILEAMAACLPVVATSVGGTPEVIVEGETGLLVPARSPSDMAAAILGLAQDGARRAALGTRGRERVTRTFSIDRMLTEYAQLYTAQAA